MNGATPASTAMRPWMKWLLWWVGVSIPLCYLIYVSFPPTYEAVSTLRVEPSRPSLFPESSVEAQQTPPIERFIESQMAMITTNRVLKSAIGYPTVANLPVIRESADPLQTVRDRLRVTNKERTVLVQVAFESDDPQGAAAVVNAVVTSYLEHVRDTIGGRERKEMSSRQNYLNDLEVSLRDKQEMLTKLVDRGIVQSALRPGDEHASPPIFRTATDAYYGKAAERLVQVEVDLVEAESQPGPGEARTARVDTLKKIRSRLQEILESREPNPLTESDRIKASALTREIDTLSRKHEELHRRLENLKFAHSREFPDVSLVDAAVPPAAPTDNKRLKYTALAPAALLIIPACVALFGALRRRRGARARTIDAG